MSAGKQFIRTVIIVFLLMVLMIAFTMSSFYISSRKNIENLGKSSLLAETALIENYLNKGMDVLWVTADTVDNMMQSGRTNEEILNYLTVEAIHEKEQVDENFTGIYGYINGEYLDGIGWVPPAGFKPKERDWYIAAKKAGGAVAIVPPYLDAQTNTIMISISKMLPDNESVVSIDIELNEIQRLTEQIRLYDTGYGFIIDDTGLVVAHFDQKEKGKVYPLNEEQNKLVESIFTIQNGSDSIMMNGERCTVFMNRIRQNWHVVMVVSDMKLFLQLRNQIILNVIICMMIFAVIFLFCYFSYRRIRIHQNREAESMEKIDKLNTNIIKALAYTIDAKDRYTSGHSQRVANYSREIARRMGKSEDEQNLIFHAGLLHDVGKIRVPEEVINKPGKLTDEEFNQIKIHPVSSFHILKDIYEDKNVAMGAKFHHERYDGKGYPNGLDGENIPEIARIIAVADSYDAMASNRSYRNALPQEVVRGEIEKGMGTQFDPDIAKVMLNIIDDDKNYELCEHEDVIKNILAIDDENLFLTIIKKTLSAEPNYNVIGVQNYEKALEILDDMTIHLIILDLSMPEMDGFEMFKKLKEKYDVPVIFLSGDKDINNIVRATEIGASDYVTKPFVPTAFKETVHSVISSYK